MTHWIVPCNIKYYDVFGAFRNLQRVEWKQSTKVEAGDMVYIYVGTTYSSIMYKCKAIKTNKTEPEIDDSLYIIKGDNYVNYGNYMELEPVVRFQEGDLSLEKLREHGLTGTVQGPRRAEGELLQFLLSKEK